MVVVAEHLVLRPFVEEWQPGGGERCANEVPYFVSSPLDRNGVLVTRSIRPADQLRLQFEFENLPDDAGCAISPRRKLLARLDGLAARARSSAGAA